MNPTAIKVLSPSAKATILSVDTGLMLYWASVILDIFPESLRFRDYSNDIMQAWNWSFFPLDVSAAFMVYLGAFMMYRNRPIGDWALIIGLTLTFCAGFMAISFWWFYGDFELFWWSANALLMVAPTFVLISMTRSMTRISTPKADPSLMID